jgi:hypothetical protein
MRITIVPSLQYHQRGWLLRWRDPRRVQRSHWFAGLEGAEAVKRGLLAGQAIEDALQTLRAESEGARTGERREWTRRSRRRGRRTGDRE